MPWEWDPDSPGVAQLQADLGFRFRNLDLLKQSLTHDSMVVGNPNLPTYQRLEFFGDAVVQVVLTEWLYRKYPQDSEGSLSQKRTEMVSGKKQLEIAHKLNLPNLVLMAGCNSCQPEGGFKRWDKFVESILGGVYLDAGDGWEGQETAKRVVYRLWNIEN